VPVTGVNAGMVMGNVTVAEGITVFPIGQQIEMFVANVGVVAWAEVNANVISNWTEVNDNVVSSWSATDDSVTSNWVEVDDSVSSSWTEVNTSVNNNWTEVNDRYVA